MQSKKEEDSKEHAKEHAKKPVPVMSTRPLDSPKILLSVDKKLLVIAVIGIALLLFFTFKLESFSGLFTRDVVVTVNDVDITEQDIQEQLNNLPAYYLTSGIDEETLRTVIIDQLIAKTLLYDQAKKLGIRISDEEIDQAINTIMRDLTNEEFAARLEEQGLTEKSLRELLEEQIAINKVVEQEVIANIEVTEEEIQTYFDQTQDVLVEVRASHILICYSGAVSCGQNRTKEEAYDLAVSLIEQIKSGESFDTLALSTSDDPSVELNKGDLGWFTKGQMVPEFETAAFSLNIGEMTDLPVETAYGYHIIYVTDKKETVEDLKDKIIETVTFEKQKTLVEQYLAVLRQQADIVFEE